MESVVLKISGSLTDELDSIRKVVEWVRVTRSKGSFVTIIHGGGKQINALATSLNYKVHQIKGRRVTDQKALDVLLYTVGGSVNAGLVSSLRAADIASVGLSGADAGLTTAIRRPPLEIDGEPVDFQLVGEIISVNPSILQILHRENLVPVIGCLTWSQAEGLLNINADTFAIEIAIALQANRLIMLMEPRGVLDSSGSILSHLTERMMERGLTQGWIRDGMIPKLHTGFKAISKGISQVLLTNSDGLLDDSGTLLTSEREL
jgi:acetylglutamate kinase